MRRFKFQTRRAVINALSHDFRGLSDDAEGKTRITKSGFDGYMTEERLRRMPQIHKEDLWFPMVSSYNGQGKPNWKYLSAAELIRILDGLEPWQCPKCQIPMVFDESGIGKHIRCPQCRYSEVLA